MLESSAEAKSIQETVDEAQKELEDARVSTRETRFRRMFSRPKRINHAYLILTSISSGATEAQD